MGDQVRATNRRAPGMKLSLRAKTEAESGLEKPVFPQDVEPDQSLGERDHNQQLFPGSQSLLDGLHGHLLAGGRPELYMQVGSPEGGDHIQDLTPAAGGKELHVFLPDFELPVLIAEKDPARPMSAPATVR